MPTFHSRHGPLDVATLPSMSGWMRLLCERRRWGRPRHFLCSLRLRGTPAQTPSTRRPARRRGLGLLGLLAKHEDLEAFETQLRFPQGKQQPKVVGQDLDQDPPILGTQRITLDSLNQRFPFLPT